jgi:putative ABC transport system substrate-binding protein
VLDRSRGRRLVARAARPALGLLAVTLLSTLLAAADPSGKVLRIGYLSPHPAAMDAPRREAFRLALEELGYRDGRNVTIDHRWAEGELDRQDELAAELVRLKVDVIVAAGGHRTVRAAKKATTTAPIVMTFGPDPVAAGLVASLGRPGGNVTGLYTLTAEVGARRLELLREILPSLHRVGVLWNPAVPERAEEFKNTEAAARPLRLAIQSLEVRSAEDLDDRFKAIVKGRAEALVVFWDQVTAAHRGKIVDFATRHRLPTLFTKRASIEAGGLMSYAASDEELFRRAAGYVDRLLKGGRPAELPVQAVTRLELVLNLGTARALGLALPPLLVQRADHVVP